MRISRPHHCGGEGEIRPRIKGRRRCLRSEQFELRPHRDNKVYLYILNSMSERRVFPDSGKVRGLSQEAEPFARYIKSRIDAPKNRELREPTEKEKLLLQKAEWAANRVLVMYGAQQPPAINHAKIGLVGDTIDLSLSHQGKVYLFSTIELRGLDQKSPFGNRFFLRTAIHEMLHAKSTGSWTIGKKTTLNRSGMHRISTHFVERPGKGIEMMPGDEFFSGYNEATTEMLTGIGFRELRKTTWFKDTQQKCEQDTQALRKEFADIWQISDDMVGYAYRAQNGKMRGSYSYFFEQKLLNLILGFVGRSSGLSKEDVVRALVSDYSKSEFTRMKPLLKKAFGPDAFKLLATWRPDAAGDGTMKLLKYFGESSPAVRKAVADQVLSEYRVAQT